MFNKIFSNNSAEKDATKNAQATFEQTEKLAPLEKTEEKIISQENVKEFSLSQKEKYTEKPSNPCKYPEEKVASPIDNSDKKLQRHKKKLQNQKCLSKEKVLTEILAILCNYGLLSKTQILQLFPDKMLWHEELKETLEVIEIQGEDIYFHTEKSINLYANLIGTTTKSLGKVLLSSQINKEDIPAILTEIDILLACKNQKKYELFNFISANNPKNKRMTKIKRCDGKRGTLAANLLIVMRRKNCRGVFIFDTTIVNTMHMLPGEKILQYQDLLQAYHEFLSKPEKVEKWLQKFQILIPGKNVGLVILLPAKENNLLTDLLETCQTYNIATPIFFARQNAFFKKPFASMKTNAVDVSTFFLSNKKKNKQEQNDRK